MAFSFPQNPTLNQTYTFNSNIWKFNGKGWAKDSAGGASVTASATAPASPTDGAMWLDSESGDLYVYGGGNWILTGVNPGPSFSGSYNDLTDKPTITTVSPSAISDQINTSTGYFGMPNGTTAQRPSSPTTGAVRLNTQTNYVEMYSNGIWNNLNYLGGILATGGTVTTIGNYKVHTFTSSGSFQIISSPPASTIDLLVVAGGGTGGKLNAQGQRAGGGGAGGLVYIQQYPISDDLYTISVGAGGAGNSATTVSSGGNSVISGNGGTITALGGGSGGYDDNTDNATSGGSGGGGWYPGYTGKASTQPINTNDGKAVYTATGWGNKGGDSSSAQPYAGGGGGAGAAGGNWNGTNGPRGGVGKQFDISGTLTYYAGGGGGAGFPGAGGYVEYAGGLGGGGIGSNDSYDVISNGTAYTGGGGGSGGSGGSGVVIIKYRYQ